MVTYVICSSKVKKLRDSTTEGINTYRVRLIQLKEYDADTVLEKLIGKTEDSITRVDIITLLFAPLMGGRSEQKDRILRCISILKNAVSDSTEVNYSIIFDMKQGALSAPVFPLSFLLFQFEPPLKFNFFSSLRFVFIASRCSWIACCDFVPIPDTNVCFLASR